MVESARAETGGDRAAEHRRRDVFTRTVRADDQQRSNNERDREPSLVQHTPQKRPGQCRPGRRRNRHPRDDKGREHEPLYADTRERAGPQPDESAVRKNCQSSGLGHSDVISETDIERVAHAGAKLPPVAEVHLEDNFVMNLFVTVLDYMLNTTVVVRSLEYFRENRWAEIRTLDELERAMNRFSNDQVGNTALAVYLWGYKLWTRAEQLRALASFFLGIGVTDQQALKAWAHKSEFRRDFQGRVKGLGRAVYESLVMRQGVDTVKPDVHVRRFAEAAVGRSLNDSDVVDVVSRAARKLRIKAYELDWRIWEASRAGALPLDDRAG